MVRIASFGMNVVLNAFVLLIAPFLVLAWIVRVHTIEYLQARRALARTAQAKTKTGGEISGAELWRIFGGTGAGR